MSDKEDSPLFRTMFIDNDHVACFDVDETLVMWEDTHGRSDALVFENGSIAYPNLRHIEELKRHKARGHLVVVWSQGGYAWAKTAVDILGISKHVDIVMCKPKWLWDDKEAQEWSTRYYAKA